MENKELEKLRPLLNKKGNGQTLEQFYRAINEIFHDVEAQYYDTLHQNMWQSLQPIYDALLSNPNELGIYEDKGLHLLDIGCGTGLGTEMILRTQIANNIQQITLLDSSESMLNQAKTKSTSWGIPCEFIHGYIEVLKNRTFDIILCSSVLHHIPSLETFCYDINMLQQSGGLFIHTQDPNALAIIDQRYEIRRKELETIKQDGTMTLRKKLYKLKRQLVKLFKADYMSEVNDILIREGHIKQKLTDNEIWAVTDIHVEGNIYGSESGMSLVKLNEYLKNYSCLREKYYAFFGPLWYDLPEALKPKEIELQHSNDKTGRNIAAIWIKN